MKAFSISCFKSAVCFGSITVLLLAAPVRANDVERTGTFEGTLQGISLTDRTIAVERARLTKRFRLDPQASISTLEKKENATLNDLRSGFKVLVTYSESNRIAAASSIVEMQPPSTQNAPSASGSGLSSPLPTVISNVAHSTLAPATHEPVADEAKTEADVGITQRIRKSLMADESLAPTARNISIGSVDGK